MWDSDGPDRHFCFWLLAHLRSIDNGCGFCYTDNIVLKVHISKFQSKDLAFTKPRINSQVKQDADLLGYLLVNFIIAYCVGNPGVVCSLVAGDFQ